MEAPRPIDPEVVVVAEDPLARSGLGMLLGSQGISVALAGSPAEAADAKADVAVWDLGADVQGALALLPALENESRPVVALLPDGTHAASIFAAGARGILLRASSGPSLLAAVRAVHAGLVVVDPAPMSRLVPTRDPLAPVEDLTAREHEVMTHLSSGLSNKEIAAKMHISDHTVKFHVNAILSKLGVASRTEAVVQAARRGWVIL